MFRFLLKTLLPIYSFFLVATAINAQEAVPELVYGCENCILTSFLPMGEQKVLIYASNKRPMKRKMYLLDKANLVVDEMKIDAAQSFVKVNDSIFSPLDVSYSLMINTANNRFEVVEAYEFYNGKQHGINTPNTFLNPDYIVGRDYVERGPNETGTQIILIKRPGDKIINPSRRFRHMGYGFTKNPPFDYGFISAQDTTVILHPNGKMIGKHNETFTAYYGYKEGVTFIWSSTHKTLVRLDKEGRIQRSKVPVKNDNTEMKMLFDQPYGEVYLLAWESGLGDDASKTYTLHKVDDANQVKPIYNLSFFPLVIDKGYVYEGRQGRKSFDVFRYPLKGQVPEKIVPFEY
ncbi:hypothetical protein A3SI_10959 [Nitritalea halalkaliphila LW7]|uniref:Uncharacterized protein n=1 Tax=Nitritalea halalkaliphila LW7 TaxID=1189621 RepID=I5C2U7_9BACT|nr:hypothetical protein [Nitritalea halalkaliphila]EIM76149.1 hypothetical protein A3SI_10959 [Nitritalea halalkaliphila LW7]